MSKAKFTETFEFLFPHGKAAKFCQQIFSVFDTDATGFVEFGEFLLSISLTRPGHLERKLANAFVVYDLDRNGFVERREMERFIGALCELMEAGGSRDG